MADIDELVIYRNFNEGGLLDRMAWTVRHFHRGDRKEKVRKEFFSCMNGLVDLAGTYGFEGNLWHDYLTLLLVNHENVFSTACEIRGITDGSLLLLAKHDFEIFMKLFQLDFSEMERKFGADFFEEILHYRRGDVAGKVFNRRIRDRICELAGQLARDAGALTAQSGQPAGTGSTHRMSSGSAAKTAVGAAEEEPEGTTPGTAEDRPESMASGAVAEPEGTAPGTAEGGPESIASGAAAAEPEGTAPGTAEGGPESMASGAAKGQQEDTAPGDLESFTAHMIHFYREFGVGRLGLHKAFRVAHTDGGVQILPITNIAHVSLDDLVGCELQKKKLIENTEAFVEGRRANNCLLFGDAGTGKSTSIKAILNRYYDRGLRMIEIYKHQFQDLNAVIAQIKSRNYRFILFMDDLSFEEFEIEYKYLKAVIEGGLERTPDNVLIYATSNRRHLIRERFADNEEGDIRLPSYLNASNGGDTHVSDTVQEKLSLSSRFGVTIYFGSPDKRQFQKIVQALAERNGIKMPQEQLFSEANKWELSHGGLSGRTAQQFVDYLLGTRQPQ